MMAERNEARAEVARLRAEVERRTDCHGGPGMSAPFCGACIAPPQSCPGRGLGCRGARCPRGPAPRYGPRAPLGPSRGSSRSYVSGAGIRTLPVAHRIPAAVVGCGPPPAAEPAPVCGKTNPLGLTCKLPAQHEWHRDGDWSWHGEAEAPRPRRSPWAWAERGGAAGGGVLRWQQRDRPHLKAPGIEAASAVCAPPLRPCRRPSAPPKGEAGTAREDGHDA